MRVVRLDAGAQRAEMHRDVDTKGLVKYPNNIGYCIKKYGYTPTEVADEIGIARRTLYYYISGERAIPRYCLEKIAKTLGCAVEELRSPIVLTNGSIVPLQENESDEGPTNQFQLVPQRLSRGLQETAEQIGLTKDYEVDRRQANKTIAGLVGGLFIASASGRIGLPPLAELWADDLLTNYARGVAACQDLYYNGNPYQVEAILPLYSHQTALLAQQTGALQQPAARLASQAYQLACELATDREDFGTARQTGRQAFSYAQLAGDSNLQVAALIGLANLGWHLSSAQPSFIRKHSKDALQAYKQAVSLLSNNVTPLLKGRTYAGIAEVYAMRGQFQEALQAMGLAYELYPMKPEEDPAYSYLRASRYSLYVFGDAQTRLLLGQPKEADKALIAMQEETNDPQIEPISKVDLLYYQAEVQIQQGELEPGTTILTEAAQLSKSLGSRLYFNKLAVSYHQLEERWPKEPLVVALEEVFQPW